MFRQGPSLGILAIVIAMLGVPFALADSGRPLNENPTITMFDQSTAEWHVVSSDNQVASFYFGVPGDVPVLGDWDCDGDATAGVYRADTSRLHYQNNNATGMAERSFRVGSRGDLLLAGDWNGDGCDTIATYRPSNGRVTLYNWLDSKKHGKSFYFGLPGDVPLVGDFDGNGIDGIAVYRPGDGTVYVSNQLSTGMAELEFRLGLQSDVLFTGDWNADGSDTISLFRPNEGLIYLFNTLGQGVADASFAFGEQSWIPVSGGEGALPTTTTTTTIPPTTTTTTTTIPPTTTTTIPPTTTTTTTTTTTIPPTTTTTIPPTTTTTIPPTTTTTIPPTTTTTIPPTTTTTIPPTTIPSPVPSGAINVKDFGARGNGSTDDTGAIAAAVSSMTSGSVLYLPQGTYMMSSPLEIMGKTDVSVIGDGQGLSIIKARTSIKKGIQIANSSSVTIRDLTVDMNKAGTTDQGSASSQMGIYVIATTGSMHNVTIEDVGVRNVHQRGIVLVNNTSRTMDGLRLNRVRLQAIDEVGVFVSGVQGLTIENSELVNVGNNGDRGREGIVITGSSNVQVANNELTNIGWHGVATGNSSTGLNISNNLVENTGTTRGAGYGIVISRGSWDVVVNDNTVVNSKGGGIAVDVAVTTPEYQTYQVGLSMNRNLVVGSATGHAMYLNHVRGGVLTNNTTRDNPGGMGIALIDSKQVTVNGHTSTRDKRGLVIGSSSDVANDGDHTFTNLQVIDPTIDGWIDGADIPSRFQ